MYLVQDYHLYGQRQLNSIICHLLSNVQSIDWLCAHHYVLVDVFSATLAYYSYVPIFCVYSSENCYRYNLFRGVAVKTMLKDPLNRNESYFTHYWWPFVFLDKFWQTLNRLSYQIWLIYLIIYLFVCLFLSFFILVILSILFKKKKKNCLFYLFVYFSICILD